MSLIGLDLDATRVRAVSGPRPRSAAALPLEGQHLDLPLALSLEGRQPAVGRAGLALCRRLPHLACLDFLPHLGGAQRWQAGRHRLDAEGALALVFADLQGALHGAQGVALSLPVYLAGAQVGQLRRLAERARWRLFGSLPTPLAAALAHVGQGGEPTGVVLVGDVDGFALTWSAVEVRDGRAVLLGAHSAPHLARGAWLCRLLDGVAHRCVRMTRRDPRESADAEQSLYEQLGHLLDALPAHPLVELSVQGGSWFQHLMLRPEELEGFTQALLRQALGELGAFRAATAGYGPIAAVVLTHSAGRLPGLAAAVEQYLGNVVVGVAEEEVDEADFGAGLLDEGAGPPVRVLPPDAVARAAHEVAVRVHGGELAAVHLDGLPLASGPVADAGPARLSFRGQDHILSKPTFTLGRDPACDLVFESELYPTVSARHCEVLFDRRAYMLCDRSRHGTLLNDRPVSQSAALHSGDWIRLGPTGPVLRFLGRSASGRSPSANP
jgi:hypothetical protein